MQSQMGLRKEASLWTKLREVMEFQLSYFKSWKMILWKCCTQYVSKLGDLRSGYRTSFQGSYYNTLVTFCRVIGEKKWFPEELLILSGCWFDTACKTKLLWCFSWFKIITNLKWLWFSIKHETKKCNNFLIIHDWYHIFLLFRAEIFKLVKKYAI